MAYRNTFFRWLFLYSLTFGLTYVLKLFTYLCPETGHPSAHISSFRWVHPIGRKERQQAGLRNGAAYGFVWGYGYK